jgi:hypothetical protein
LKVPNVGYNSGQNLGGYAVRRFSVSDTGKSAMQERLKLAIHTKSVVAVYAKP